MLKSNDKKISMISHITFVAIFIALLGVASVYDLSISHAMSNDASLFGQIFVALGEFPAYIILPICGGILFYNNWAGKPWVVISIKVFCAFMVFGGFFLWGVMGSRLVEVPNKLGQSIIYALLLTPATILIVGMAGKERLQTLAKWSTFAIVVVAASLALSWLLKLGWGRMRYRDMLTAGEFSGYTPWYQPQGFGTNNTGFPSGHTSSACNLFIFAALFDFRPKLKPYRYLAYAVATIFTILTGLSRIVINAHFLSDVLVGGAVSYATYYAIKALFFNKKAYQFLPKERDNND